MKKCVFKFLVAVSLFGACSSSRAQEPSNRFQALPADSIAIVSVDLTEIRKLKELEFVPWEIISVGSKEQMGIDVLLADTVDVVLGMPGPSGVEFGASILTSADVDIADLNLPDLKEVQTSPRRAELRFREMNYSPVRFAQQTGKQLYFGTDSMLRRMLAAKNSQTPATKIAGDTKSPLFAVLSLEPIRPLVIGFLEDNPASLPEPLLAPLMTLAEEVDVVRVTSTPGINAKLVLDLFSDSKESIGKIASALKDVQSIGFELFATQMRASMAESPDVSEEMMAAVDKYTVRLKSVFEKSLWTQNEDHLSLDLQSNSAATVGIAVGMLLPAVQSARVSAQRMQSMNNQKQIMLAFHNFESSYRQLPNRAWKKDADGKPLLSWRVALLPYIEQGNLFNQFNLDEPWDSPHNIQLLELMPDVYRNPKIPTEPGYTTYLMPYGEGTPGSEEGRLRFAMFTDGLSNTIAVVEVDSEYAVPWTAPDDINIEDIDLTDAFPEKGSNVGIWDGSVRFFSKTFDLELLDKLLTHRGGELVTIPD